MLPARIRGHVFIDEKKQAVEGLLVLYVLFEPCNHILFIWHVKLREPESFFAHCVHFSIGSEDHLVLLLADSSKPQIVETNWYPCPIVFFVFLWIAARSALHLLTIAFAALIAHSRVIYCIFN